MAAPQSWVKKSLKHLNLSTVEPERPALDEFRRQIERCNLIVRMQETHDLINKEMGRIIVFQDLYIQPQAIMCKYTLETPKVHYQMALVLRENGPALVFSSHRPSAAAGQGAIENFCRKFLPPSMDVIKHELPVNPEVVNDIDLQEWFSYLLSGLRNSYKPLVKKQYGQAKLAEVRTALRRGNA
jgi:hypothetical protein